MVTDLHTKLRTAIEARLALAQALGVPGDYNVQISGDLAVPLVEYIAANSPDLIIRACRADLDRLERHKSFDQPDWSVGQGGFTAPACEYCELTSNDGDPLSRDWPCAEILSLAEVYAVEVDE